MKALKKTPLFFLALLINVVLFLIVPLIQIIMGPSSKAPKKKNHEVAIETFVQKQTQKQEQKQLKTLRTLSKSFKPSSPIQRNVSMNLSAAAGGEGVAVTSGDIGAVTYLPGETDTDAEVVSGPPQPEMPLRAQREGMSGIVDAFWIVNESGFAIQVDILREEPGGYGFAKEVRSYLKALKFRPATIKNVPVRQQLKQRFSFDVQ